MTSAEEAPLIAEYGDKPMEYYSQETSPSRKQSLLASFAFLIATLAIVGGVELHKYYIDEDSRHSGSSSGTNDDLFFNFTTNSTSNATLYTNATSYTNETLSLNTTDYTTTNSTSNSTDDDDSTNSTSSEYQYDDRRPSGPL